MNRYSRQLTRLIALWFLLALGVAIASPLVQPKSIELVCSSAGDVRMVVNSDDGAQQVGSLHWDCPLCLFSALPPTIKTIKLAMPLPLGYALQPIPAAKIAAATAAPLPARGPPTHV